MAHFWNAGDGPCRILEIISPAGFEHYFDELAAGVGSPEDYQARLAYHNTNPTPLVEGPTPVVRGMLAG